MTLSSCCCTCAAYKNDLLKSSIPGGLTVKSGTWTAGSFGLATTSTDAKILVNTFPTSPYEGNSFSITVDDAEAGDVAVIYFNNTWQARWVCDDGSGTVGSFAIYDDSGELINISPSDETGGTTLSLCITSDADSGDFEGGAVSFGLVGAALTVTTLEIGFGSGSQNTGGLIFTALEVDRANYSEGTDPKSCGDCTCGFVPPWRGLWAELISLTFTISISGITDNTADFPDECGDCGKQNGNFTLDYLPGPNSNSGFTGQWHCDVDGGPTCLNPDDELTGQFDILMGGGGCEHTTISLSGLLWCYSFSTTPIDIGFLDFSDIAAVNTAISDQLAAALSVIGCLNDALTPEPVCLPSAVPPDYTSPTVTLTAA